MKLEWEVENKGALDVSAEGEFERLTKGDRRFSDAEREGWQWRYLRRKWSL